MTEVKRWDLVDYSYMEQDDHGDFVFYEDYEKLMKRVKILEDRVIALQGHDNLKFVDVKMRG